MQCAIHGKQTIAKKMKADLDEMIENPDEGIYVHENYLEVFTEGPATKPEVPAPTQAEMESFILLQQWSSFSFPRKCFDTRGAC